MNFITGSVMAIQSLTRIYIVNLPFDEKKFGQSTSYFPIVGLVVGIFLYSLYAAGIKFFSPLVVSSLLLCGQLIVTGGMHLDGFMDSMDGLFSGRQKDRKLEIMKDSRVGANGVMALAVLFFLKFALYVSLVQLPAAMVLAILVTMTTLGRWSMVYAIKGFPYLTKGGLGELYKRYTGNKELAVASILTGLIVFLTFLLGGILPIKGLVVYGIAFLFTLLLARQITKTIGGMTGDTYGAITEMLEVLILLIFLFNN